MTRRGLIIGLAASTALAACQPPPPGPITGVLKEIHDLVQAFVRLENDFASIPGLAFDKVQLAIEQMQVLIISVVDTVSEESKRAAERILSLVQGVLDQVTLLPVNTPVSTLVSAVITLIPIIARAFNITIPFVSTQVAAYEAHYPRYDQEQADRAVASLAYSGEPIH